MTNDEVRLRKLYGEYLKGESVNDMAVWSKIETKTLRSAFRRFSREDRIGGVDGMLDDLRSARRKLDRVIEQMEADNE